MMTLDRFRTLADAWGADLARWPQPDRDAARALLASADAAAARAILHQAATLDAALAHELAPLPAALADRILATSPSFPHAGAAAGREPAPHSRSTPAQAALRRHHPARPWRRFAASGRSYAKELGGLRVLGPALAAALVLGVALAELRGAADAAAEQDTLLSAALLAGDYEEFTL